MWLREGGHLFVRESCFHSASGVEAQKKRAFNPTIYRAPLFYASVLQSLAVPADDDADAEFRFEVQLQRSIQTYIKARKKMYFFETRLTSSHPTPPHSPRRVESSLATIYVYNQSSRVSSLSCRAAQAEPEPGVLARAEGARGRRGERARARAPGTPLATEPAARARRATVLDRAVRLCFVGGAVPSPSARSLPFLFTQSYSTHTLTLLNIILVYSVSMYVCTCMYSTFTRITVQ